MYLRNSSYIYQWQLDSLPRFFRSALIAFFVLKTWIHIQCTLHVSGISFIRSANYRNIGEPNSLKVFGNSKTEEHISISLFMIYHRVCNQINTTGVTSGAGTAYLFEAPEFIPSFSGVRVTRSLVLYVCFVDRCLSFCVFFFWPLSCLSSSIYGF